MPIYEIENTETGEIFEILMKISDKERLLQKNPHFRQVPSAPALNFGGVGDRVKRDGGMNDVLSKIADANPSSPCLLYTSPSPRDKRQSRMPSSA